MAEAGETPMDADARTAFISYASQDAAVAQQVVSSLEHAGISCWIAPRDVEPGALYADEIVRAINESRVVVLVLSSHAAASTHVGKELERASSKNRRIIALRTDATPLPRAFEYFLSESQWIEVGPGGIAPAAVKLVESVRRHLGVPTATPAPGSVLATAPSSPKRTRRLALGLAAALVVAVGAAAAWKLWFTNPSVAGQASASTGIDRSVAVLPFVNMSSDKEQEYFSDGLSEELLNELAQIRELRVAGRTSSFSFKGKNEDLRVISEKLGVGHILEGSVRKNGNRLRITAQLIQGRDGTHLWSQTYDREMSDIFAVQQEIAMAVSEALSITLDVGEMSRSKGGTTDIEAYGKYLHARTLTYQLGPNELVQALGLYREAVALDPEFARAWAGLYSALVTSLNWLPENRETDLKEMSGALARSVELAPKSWWTQLMVAGQAMRQRKWAEAEAAARAAIAAAPASEASAHMTYGLILSGLGRLKEGDSAVERALRIEPLSLAVSGMRQLTLDLAGKTAEAQAEYQRSRDFAGDHAIWDFHELKRLWFSGASEAAVAAQFRIFLKSESLPMALSSIAAENLGNRAASLAATRQAFDDPSNQDGTRMSVVAFYADHFGDRDLAFAALRRTFLDLRYGSFIVLWYPYKLGLRADPRFKDLLRDLGLAQYYRSSGTWPDLCKPVGTGDFECH
jgi:TolB-like protein/tetratricopeptide (TPR) repeat protein